MTAWHQKPAVPNEPKNVSVRPKVGRSCSRGPDDLELDLEALGRGRNLQFAGPTAALASARELMQLHNDFLRGWEGKQYDTESAPRSATMREA